MRSPRTAGQLLEGLDADLAWRLKEIASLRKAIRASSGPSQSAILRASVTALYAHWEGFVKDAAINYSAYISNLGVTFGAIRQSLSGLRGLSYVTQMHGIKKRIFVSSQLLAALRGVDVETASLPLRNHIDKVGNLNYSMFEQIAEFLAIDSSPYSSKRQLIDVSLLRQRNEIAHGEYLMVDADDFESLSNEVLAIMRQFKNDIQNAAVQKDYLRT